MSLIIALFVKIMENHKQACIVCSKDNVMIRGSVKDLMVMVAACLQTMAEKGLKCDKVITAMTEMVDDEITRALHAALEKEGADDEKSDLPADH